MTQVWTAWTTPWRCQVRSGADTGGDGRVHVDTVRSVAGGVIYFNLSYTCGVLPCGDCTLQQTTVTHSLKL